MQTSFTLDFIKDNCGCYVEYQIVELTKGKELFTYKDIVNSTIPLKDKYWFFCRKIFTKEQNQQVAIIVAEIVLPIYEEKYPENKAPRESIEAAKLYIKKEITLEQLMVKRRAAVVDAGAGAPANAAADAVANAAADAVANAAYYAANAAASAAASAADAAYAAAYADAYYAIYAAAAAANATDAANAADAADDAAAAADDDDAAATLYAADSYKQKLEKALTNFIESN